MYLLLSLLAALVGFILLILLLALLIRNDHYVKRTIVIDAPVQKVFGYLRFLKNQDQFNDGAQAGAEREKTYRGTDGTAGFIYSWKGDKDAGEGEKEIHRIEEGKLIEMELRFVKPMKTSSRIIMTAEPLSATQTEVTWSNAGRLKYPFNLFVPMLEKKLPGAMDKSLGTLKSILEQ